MTPEEFEQLLNTWLDEPQRRDLVEALEKTAASNPALRELKVHYQRLDALARAATRLPEVDWSRLCRRISAAVDEAAQASLDEQVRRLLPDISTRVNWDRLYARLVGAIARVESRRKAVRQFRYLSGAAALAAAASLALWVTVANWWSGRLGVRPTVTVSVNPPGRGGAAVQSACVVRAQIVPPPAQRAPHSGPPVAVSEVLPTSTGDPEVQPADGELQPELFFLLDMEEPVADATAEQTNLC